MSILRKSSKQTAVAGILAVATALVSCSRDAKGPTDTALAAEVAELEAKLAFLSDRQQIHDTYLRYMRGFDRNDVALMKSAFWADAQINYGSQSNSLDEFVVRHLPPRTKEHPNYAHLISNESVDIEGDVAYVEGYVTRLANDNKERSAIIVSGRYVDRLDRRNGEWRIAVREFILHFAMEASSTFDSVFSGTMWSRTDCGKGTRDKRDPSYRRPFTPRNNRSVGPECAE